MGKRSKRRGPKSGRNKSGSASQSAALPAGAGAGAGAGADSGRKDPGLRFLKPDEVKVLFEFMRDSENLWHKDGNIASLSRFVQQNFQTNVLALRIRFSALLGSGIRPAGKTLNMRQVALKKTKLDKTLALPMVHFTMLSGLPMLWICGEKEEYEELWKLADSQGHFPIDFVALRKVFTYGEFLGHLPAAFLMGSPRKENTANLADRCYYSIRLEERAHVYSYLKWSDWSIFLNKMCDQEKALSVRLREYGHEFNKTIQRLGFDIWAAIYV